MERTSSGKVNCLPPTTVLAMESAVVVVVVADVAGERDLFFSSETPYKETTVRPLSFSEMSPDSCNSFLISSIQNWSLAYNGKKVK